jgi:hypothetical protein
VCVCVCVCVCVSCVCVYEELSLHTCVCVCVCVCACVCVCVCVCVCNNMHTQSLLCACTCASVCVHAYVCTLGWQNVPCKHIRVATLLSCFLSCFLSCSCFAVCSFLVCSCCRALSVWVHAHTHARMHTCTQTYHGESVWNVCKKTLISSCCVCREHRCVCSMPPATDAYMCVCPCVCRVCIAYQRTRVASPGPGEIKVS